MATGTQTSLEEYLATSFRPDCDYVDGVVLERNLGERDHSRIQSRFIVFFGQLRRKGFEVLPELRMRVRANKYRIPDVVLTRGNPDEQVLTKPPLLCIEVLSKDDTLSRTNERVRDYLEFGVPVVWVADPSEKRIWVYRSTGMEEAIGSVNLDGTDIEVPFSEIFD